MLVPAAEARFGRGMEALRKGRGVEALALFEAALALEKRYGSGPPQARYLSYYGLCLALEGRRVREGVECCRQALPLEYYNPELYLNYARVLLTAGRKKDAWEALNRGAQMQPTHVAIRKELDRMGRRRRPPIPFLSRQHPLNVFLGRVFRTTPSREASRSAAEASS